MPMLRIMKVAPNAYPVSSLLLRQPVHIGWIERLRVEGHDTTKAEELLSSFRRTLETLQEDRLRILNSVKSKPRPPWTSPSRLLDPTQPANEMIDRRRLSQ
jgi:hypothetical protein